MYVTSKQSLSFWARFEERLLMEFEHQRVRCAELLAPRTTTFGQAAVAFERAEADRQEAFSVLRRMELLKLLATTVHASVRQAEVESGITHLRYKINALTDVINLYRDHFCGKPSLARAQADLELVHQRFQQLSAAGNSELALTERQRISERNFPVYVVSDEDGKFFETSAQNLHSLRDENLGTLEFKQSSTELALKFDTEGFTDLLDYLGVVYSLDTAAGPQPQFDAEKEATLYSEVTTEQSLLEPNASADGTPQESIVMPVVVSVAETAPLEVTHAAPSEENAVQTTADTASDPATAPVKQGKTSVPTSATGMAEFVGPPAPNKV